MIIVSEIGDKTFWIACILAMRHPRVVIFVAALSALGLMTAISAALGLIVPMLIPPSKTHWVAMVLFAIFGVRLLHEAYNMTPDDETEELHEVQEELREKHLMSSESDDDDLESGSRRPGISLSEARREGKARKGSAAPWYALCISPVFVQCFLLTLFAEWGDRSQIATIVMAASRNPFGVTFGGTIGHALCTGLAVVGGKVLSDHISVKTVSFVGGALFVVFAIVAFVQGPPPDV